MNKKVYTRFLIMLALSFMIMYAVMYLNVYEWDHIYLNLTRFYMTSLMICPMAVLMLMMMRNMYTDRKKNFLIMVFSIVIFGTALWGVRLQIAVGDIQWMKGMIPHHSIAVLTSKNAELKDPEVRKLADSIVKAQQAEIIQMKKMIERLER
ncbi:DUF305 domain-containing protein [Mucilaginibacter conchicola]|uniref:DUF305 domain-containing protein n=1 Tax=Mucilaginibacter conchicola TaxID=2303333 RepID=A0A372NVC4_9SPHI|nr:DUF305 domain-containing protein [Mucilaginibacter conchicola]MBL4676436.1 DUF305 domain-containing protein [Mucilaginibacter sp.]RFZ93062.1 DUF305 domain-containing protein [Mucilaginibacter conchicola]